MARVHEIAAAACGFAAAALALAVPVLGGRAEPGYSHCAQFISELGATGATNAALVTVGGFAPIGALTLAFLALAARSFPGTRAKAFGVLALGAVGAAYLVAAAFPCDAGCPASGSVSQSVHNASGFFEYAGALIGLLLLAFAFCGSPRWRAMSVVSIACAIGVAVGFAAMLVPSLVSMRGLSQRIAEVAIFAWIAIASAWLVRVPSDD